MQIASADIQAVPNEEELAAPISADTFTVMVRACVDGWGCIAAACHLARPIPCVCI